MVPMRRAPLSKAFSHFGDLFVNRSPMPNRNAWRSWIKIEPFHRPLTTGLSSVFNKMHIANNYILSNAETGLFNNDLLVDANGFYLLKENAILSAERLVREALNPKRRRKMVEIFDDLSNSLCLVADLAEFVRVGHPDQRFQQAAEQTSIFISAEVERLNTNLELYVALREVVETGKDIEPTTPLDNYVAQLFMFDFEQSGIHMDEDKRKEVVRLNESILHVGSYFVNNTNQPRTVPRSKLPEEVRDCFSQDGDSCIVNSLYPESENELLREAAYRIFLFPDDHQENLLRELLMARKYLASLCGFDSYAHRAVKGSIADTPEAVNEFIDCVTEKLNPLALRDYETMFKLKKNHNPYAKYLRPWDVAFYTSAFKQNRYSQDVERCLPYFSLGACMDGLNMVFRDLYQVQLNICKALQGEVWHKDVVKLSVSHIGSNEPLGFIYCDFLERPGKPNQDCHFTIQGGCELKGGVRQLPIVVLMLSLPTPTSLSPTLLNPHMVDNLFHEMGHAMHSMLGQTKYQHVTGTRCSTDLAEVPSILMEYFASDPRVVSRFAKHYVTGEAIPKNLLSSWIKSKKVFSASDTQLQVFYAALDQAYHSKDPLMSQPDSTSVLATLQNKYYGLPHVPYTAWQLRFGHLVGYGAKYYSYLVSRAVASSIWEKYFKVNPLNPESGKFFNNQVLRYGGGKPPKEIVEGALQDAVTADSLANALIDDVLEHSSDDDLYLSSGNSP